MTEHPITPPPELTQEWSCDCPLTDPFNRELYIATLAARWGADQELEACCQEVQDWYGNGSRLRAARRPKPPSLKEQALELVNEMNTGRAGWLFVYDKHDTIRRALEALPDE